MVVVIMNFITLISVQIQMHEFESTRVQILDSGLSTI